MKANGAETLILYEVPHVHAYFIGYISFLNIRTICVSVLKQIELFLCPSGS